MKTKARFFLVAIMIIISTCTVLKSQQEKIAVLNIDVQGLDYEEALMSNLVRLELEKRGVYNVVDKYDIKYIMEKEGFDCSNCYGKICLSEAGKILNVEKILAGSIEKYDNKIIVILRLIDVDKEVIEKADIMEYVDAPEIQRMIGISINNILGIPNEQLVLDQIESLDNPINSPKTKLCLTGPRMGVSYVGDVNGEVIQAPLNKGGFDSYPISTQIGYQQEIAYISSGNFQALVEFIPMISGMEQGRFVPSLIILNGVRSNKNGLEIAFGPVFDVTRVAKGFYDKDGNWFLEDEWGEDDSHYLIDDADNRYLPQNPYDISKRLDSRGDLSIAPSWVWAIGKSFRSGYINIPVNVYFSLKRNGWVAGASFGFNISK